MSGGRRYQRWLAWSPWYRRQSRDAALERELRDHLDLEAEEQRAAGLSADEAPFAAQRALGNTLKIEEDVRAARGFQWLEVLAQDARYGLRVLRNSPGFAAVAILTLALGIGANTALFSVVNGVLFNPLPYPQADRLLALSQKTSDFPHGAISYPNFMDWHCLNHTFASLAAFRQSGFNLAAQSEPERVTAMEVSAAFFPLLGVSPVAGRNFSDPEDETGGPLAVILSGGFWKTRFGSSPGVIGKALNLNGRDYTVVGVLPDNFYFCCTNFGFHLSDVYVPIGTSRNPWMHDRRLDPGIFAIGRMLPGVTLAQARADMDGIAQTLALAYPDADKNVGVALTPLKEEMVRDVQPFLLVLLAAVGFVLLIACVNVANFLLARATGRAREFAVRAAMGASQARIIRQLLTESMLLALAGGSLGLVLASWGTRAGLALLPSTLPRANDVRIDSHVLLFTLAVSLLGGILFGLAPALKTSRPDVYETLKEGGRGASGVRYRTQGLFVVAEMALAVVLLVGAGLMVRTLAHLWNVAPGFDSHNVFTFAVGLPSSLGNAGAPEIRASLRQLGEKVAAVPGVSAASPMHGTLPINGDNEVSFWLEGQAKPASENSMPETLFYMVGPEYLKVMKIRLLRGRFLTEQDTSNSPTVCVIDSDFARQFFGKQDPIGKRINLQVIYKQLEVVGIVDHVKQFGMDEGSNAPVGAQLYAATEQIPDDQLSSFTSSAGYVVRTQGSPLAIASSIRDAVRKFNSQAVVYYPESMDEIILRSLAARRFAMILLASFAAVALLLASIGIYGVVSYVTGQRSHEIGVRIALGAQRADILKIVLSHGARLAGSGVVIGLLAAAGLTRLMTSILYGVSATDPVTFLGVGAALTLVALAACYVPARRAMRVDPVVALRCE